MGPTNTDARADRQWGLFALLILTIFCTEFVLDGLCAPLFTRLNPFSWDLLDSLFLTVLFILPLWFFFVRPLYPPAPAQPPAIPAGVLLFLSLAVLFSIEYLVMIALPLTLPMLPLRLQKIADAFCTSLGSAPFLWWLFFRKEMRQRRSSGDELLQTPLRLYLVLLLMVFFLTMLQEFLCALLLPSLSKQWNELLDALLVTSLFAPVLFFLVVRPLARSALSEHARVSALYEQLIDAVVTLDGDGSIKTVNRAAEGIFGYRAADLAGENADVLFKGGRECLHTLLEMATPAVGGKALSHELIASRRDGALLTMDISVSRVTVGGAGEFLLVMRDVSERRRMQRELQESEERFRQIFHQSDDAIIFFHPESCGIADLNDTAARLYGCSKEELRSGGVEALVNREDLPALTTMISGCNGGTSRLHCVAHRRRDGRDLFLSIRGRLMTLQGVSLAYCTFRDITARVRLEEEAREMQARLIQINKMASLGLVVSGVAHEVNNPNNFILANSQLLAQVWDDALKILQEYRKEHGDFILGGLPFDQISSHIPELYEGVVDGSRRINEIINNLKSFARHGGGLEQVDVNRAVQGAVSILQYELAKHTEKFHLELAGDLPPVRGNSQQLGQVAINLLMNACQALPSRSSRIWLSTGFDAEAEEIVITVRDEGCGITQEEKGRVMEPFFTTKLDRGGTGLGLSISQSIVKEHKGVLAFDSEPGKGSTFQVRLPAGG
ncbi:PAS domain S-box protein [Geomonas sp. RF6]|uniref:PAS domain-containing sensor histidine kinase n=1 Tax=Geomonas sp. RF6 TaxID=2897342 RepID=UPI001E3BE7C4|nr:PAS domain S-box protein [Geomonas sp. RF6]UFS69607.1 PAS domain S-box protein [Geomonas sp. RF6]